MSQVELDEKLQIFLDGKGTSGWPVSSQYTIQTQPISLIRDSIKTSFPLR